MSEEVLVKSCIEGNRAAQKKLFETYSRVMMGLCLRYSSSLEEAEDLTQDGWIKVFERIHSYRFEGSLEGWIKRIMINTALDHIRRNKIFMQPIDEKTEGEKNLHSEADVFSSLSTKDLLSIIQQLPTGYRTVFNLYAIEGFTHKEIGAMLNVSESTSKSQYIRAKASLQKMLISENA